MTQYKQKIRLPFVDCPICSDVLHPGRANVSKDELRSKLAELYKANKDSVSVFGFRTHYGGGKSTGFALIYDSHEVMKKFEPHYRLVRYGAATKVEKASRQQRMDKLTEQIFHEALLTILGLQASNARTEPRLLEAPLRQRVQPKIRRNEAVTGLVLAIGGAWQTLSFYRCFSDTAFAVKRNGMPKMAPI